MRRDFEIKDGIYLSQPPHELDLHNNFDFLSIDYAVERRTLLLRWRRSRGDWVASGTPASVAVEFREVSEFRFLPRDAELPFTEDDCVSTWGYWTDEEWADVRHKAITLMEASDLIVLAGRHVAAPGQKAINPQVQLSPDEIEALIAKDRSSWVRMTHNLHDSILPALKAIDARDPMALSDSTIAIDMACESCHLKFWYPDKP